MVSRDLGEIIFWDIRHSINKKISSKKGQKNRDGNCNGIGTSLLP